MSMKNFRINTVAYNDDFEKQTVRDGLAVGKMRFVHGVTGKMPGKKRKGTTGKSPDDRKTRGRMFALPKAA